MNKAEPGGTAIERYRQQLEALGTQLQDLRYALSEVRREAQRERSIRPLLRQLHEQVAAARMQRPPVALGEQLGAILLRLLMDSVQLDAAALLRPGGDRRQLQAAEVLGLDAGFKLPLPAELPAILSGDEQSEDSEDHLALRQALAPVLQSAGLQRWGLVSAGAGDWVLLLAQRRALAASSDTALGPGVLSVAGAALDLFVGLREQELAAAARYQAELNYRTLFDSARDAFMVLDARSLRVLDANRCTQEMLGCTLERLCATPPQHWLLDVDQRRWRRHWHHAMSRRERLIECRLCDAHQRVFWCELHITRIGERDDEKLLLVGRDVSRRKQHENQLRKHAYRDELTRLPNRAFLLRRMGELLTRRQQDARYSFALLFLDIDRFKVINDSLGHSLGDQLLITFGERLRRSLRAGDTIARLGGDEFLLLMEDLKHAREAEQLTARLLAQLQTPFDVDGHPIFVTASVGIVLADGRYTGSEAMLRDADIAMYQAKRSGRSGEKYVLFNPVMHERALANMELEQDLRSALDGRQFALHYQPIVSLAEGRIVGMEALLRWHHPRRGMIAPDLFIPLAEETLLILELGRFVIGQACVRAREWASALNPPVVININLSGRQFLDSGLPDEVSAIAAANGCDPGLINLEITESAILHDIEAARASLNRLHEHGFALSMDDFGTGYSSLSYLHQFPFDSIKIDRSFVQRLDAPDAGQAASIVAAIINLSRNLGKRVVAEGIETEAQLEVLRALGCECGQGYLFARPVDAASAGALLHAGLPAAVRALMQRPMGISG